MQKYESGLFLLREVLHKLCSKAGHKLFILHILCTFVP